MGIDPGPKSSALVIWDGQRVVFSDLAPNRDIQDLVRRYARMEDTVSTRSERPTHFAIEVIRGAWGGGAGTELFDTALWSGIFIGEWLAAGRPCNSVAPLSRTKIRVHLCGTQNSGDKEIVAVLKKRIPGITGIATHKWQALAVAVAVDDRLRCGVTGKEDELLCA